MENYILRSFDTRVVKFDCCIPKHISSDKLQNFLNSQKRASQTLAFHDHFAVAGSMIDQSRFVSGQTYKVSLFTVTASLSFRDSLMFLQAQNSLPIDASMLTLLFCFYRKYFPVDRCVYAVQEQERLWIDEHRNRRVPFIDRKRNYQYDQERKRIKKLPDQFTFGFGWWKHYLNEKEVIISVKALSKR